MTLKATLEQQGVEVICVLPSNTVHIFEGQLGAAFLELAHEATREYPAIPNYENHSHRFNPIRTSAIVAATRKP
jgi:hypothetical protein